MPLDQLRSTSETTSIPVGNAYGFHGVTFFFIDTSICTYKVETAQHAHV